MSVTIQIKGMAPVEISDDLEFSGENAQDVDAYQVVAAALDLPGLGTYQPDSAQAVADALIARFGGRILSVKPPAYLNQPLGLDLVY